MGAVWKEGWRNALCDFLGEIVFYVVLSVRIVYCIGQELSVGRGKARKKCAVSREKESD